MAFNVYSLFKLEILNQNERERLYLLEMLVKTGSNNMYVRVTLESELLCYWQMAFNISDLTSQLK